VPTHQGGFLLDGGVHFLAGIRLLLGSEEPFVSLSAHTTQLQSHLPPVDTVDATLKTKNGATGTVSISFGSTFKGSGYSVACEKGVVNVMRETVKVGNETNEVQNEKTGVPPEVRIWGEAIEAGKADPRQSPEEALADLELLESMLRSGDQNGQAIPLKHQMPT
jgi:predicted dehydrogenase